MKTTLTSISLFHRGHLKSCITLYPFIYSTLTVNSVTEWDWGGFGLSEVANSEHGSGRTFAALAPPQSSLVAFLQRHRAVQPMLAT